MAGDLIARAIHGAHVLGERQQRFLVVSAVGQDVTDGIDDASQLGLLHGQRHLVKALCLQGYDMFG